MELATERELDSPIFALTVLKDIVIVASGGGNKKYGVKNKLRSFKINGAYLSKELFSLDLENNVPFCIEMIEKHNIFVVCINNLSYIYKMNLSNGKFNEIFNFKTLSTFNEDIFQSCIKISDTYFISGSSTGELKLFEYNLNIDKITKFNQIAENLSAHLRIINNIIPLQKKKNHYYCFWRWYC